MQQLLRALQRRRKNKAWLTAVGLGTCVGGFLVFQSQSGRPCTGFGAEVEAVYGADVRDAISSAFRSRDERYAETSLETTLGTLDDYAAAWVSAAHTVCLASQRGEQSPALLDVRMRCLGRGLRSLDRVVGRLRAADEGVIERATTLVQLPEPGDCVRHERALRAEYELPAGSVDAQEAQALQEELDGIDLHQDLREDDRAAALLEAIEPRVDALGDPFIGALHDLLLSKSQERGGALDDAASSAKRALLASIEANVDSIASRAASRGCYIAAELVGDVDAAEPLCHAALALSEASGSALVRRGVLGDVATLRLRQGRFEDAVDLGAERIALLRGLGPAAAPVLADALFAQADVVFAQNGDAQGDALLAEAEAIILETLGEGHPDLFYVKHSMANRAHVVGNDQQALVLASEALRIAQTTMAQDRRFEGIALVTLASAQRGVGQQWDALQTLRTADDLLVAHIGPTYPERPSVRINIASVLGAMGEYENAYREVVAVLEQEGSDGGYRRGAVVAHGIAAHLALKTEQLDEAERHARDAMAATLEIYGEDNVNAVLPNMLLGWVAKAKGREGEARAFFERAVQLDSIDPIYRAQAKIELAELLWQPGAAAEEQQRALRLAREAAADLEGRFEGEEILEQVRSFLGTHAPLFEPG